MGSTVPDSARDPKTPDDVEVRLQPPPPYDDPTLGIDVPRPEGGEPVHRLVTIGDSLTHGFQSGAIHNTRLSWPAIVAWELGWSQRFRVPTYDGYGGLPFNLEYAIRDLEHHFGDRIAWWESPIWSNSPSRHSVN